MQKIPFHRLKLTLPYDNKQVLQRILDNTEAGTFTKKCIDKKIFIGTLTENGFKLQKSLKNYRKNSFAPIVIGHFYNDNYYCQLDVIIRPSILAIAFMIIWVGYFLNILITYYIALSTISYLSLVFILFGYFLMIFAFWSEVPKVEKAIRQVLGVNECDD